MLMEYIVGGGVCRSEGGPAGSAHIASVRLMLSELECVGVLMV